jgi:hypothetical protein
VRRVDPSALRDSTDFPRRVARCLVEKSDRKLSVEPETGTTPENDRSLLSDAWAVLEKVAAFREWLATECARFPSPLLVGGSESVRSDEGSASLPTATSARIERAFNDGEGAGLLHLATIEIKTALGPTLAFARGFAQRYFTQLCHLGEPDVQPETELVVPPGEEELSAIVLEAPPMRGLEYLDAGAFRTAWCELDTRVRLEVSAHGKGVRASPLAHRWRPLQPGEKQGTLPRTGSV